MTTSELKLAVASKANIPVTTLLFSRQYDKAPDGAAEGTKGAAQPWIGYWNNEQRVRVTMHDDVANQIKANPNINTLAIKEQTVAATATTEAYLRIVVIVPREVELAI